MMNFEIYPNHCSQCGAPLIRKRNKVFCEYCGQIYFDASFDREIENNEEPLKENPVPPVEMEEKTHHWLSEYEITPEANDASEEPNIQNSKSVEYTIVIVFLIFLLAPLINISYTKHKSRIQSRETQATSTASIIQIEEEASFIQLILSKYYESAVFPAASNEDNPVATAVVLQYADANTLIFSLFVHNQSSTDIDISSLEKHLEISNIAVTSTQGDPFTCSLDKSTWKYDNFISGVIRRKGTITCSGSLNPASSLIIIDFDMPNWGSSHLEIPIQANNEDLQSNVELELAPDSYDITIELNSEKPQLVWMKKSDIVFNDDLGTTLLLDGCTPATSQQGEGEYFLTLTNPSAYDDRVYNKKLITCKYDEPFPSETNTMSASLKTTSGKTFTSQAVINKSENLILFNEKTNE